MGLPLYRPPRPVILHPSHDIILHIGGQILHACSGLLASASPVFDRLLRSRLREAYRSKETPTIPIETPYPNALAALVKILHSVYIPFKHDDTKLVARVALLAQEHQATDIVRPHVEMWAEDTWMEMGQDDVPEGYILLALYAVKSNLLRDFKLACLPYLPLGFVSSCWNDEEFLAAAPADFLTEIAAGLRGMLAHIAIQVQERLDNVRQCDAEEYEVSETRSCCECDLGPSNSGTLVCGRCGAEAGGPAGVSRCTGESRAAALERVLRDEIYASWRCKSPREISVAVKVAFRDIREGHWACGAGSQCPLTVEVRKRMSFTREDYEWFV